MSKLTRLEQYLIAKLREPILATPWRKFPPMPKVAYNLCQATGNKIPIPKHRYSIITNFLKMVKIPTNSRTGDAQFHPYGERNPCLDRDKILHCGRYPWHNHWYKCWIVGDNRFRSFSMARGHILWFSIHFSAWCDFCHLSSLVVFLVKLMWADEATDCSPLLSVNRASWTAFGRQHPHQSTISSNHRIACLPQGLLPSTVPATQPWSICCHPFSRRDWRAWVFFA